MELKPFKVSEITVYIKRILVGDPILYNMSVEGEISNFKEHFNGNMYFTLKDEKSRIRCVFFNDGTKKIPIMVEDGMQVVVTGYISVYERDGTYQIYVKDIKKKGIGELFEAFEKLKKKLELDGLFDIKHKRKLKYLPKKIGVITSSTGAAIRDIVSVTKRRMPSIDIIIYPVLVQGDKAPMEICNALEYFNNRDDIDTLIVGRGGGSIEELWAFNDERVARAIYASKTPIISAVGHETDFTIADFVADMRAPTPSVAGELAVPQVYDLNYRIKTNLISLKSYFDLIANKKKKDLQSLNNKLILNSPTKILNENRQRLDILHKDLTKVFEVNRKANKNKIEFLGSKLDALSPLAVLNRGYSIITDKNGNVIKSVNEIIVGDELGLTLSDGKTNIKIIDNNTVEGR